MECQGYNDRNKTYEETDKRNNPETHSPTQTPLERKGALQCGAVPGDCLTELCS